MHEISCEICMDLIPLVQDGVASEDSRRAVEAHVASCPQCRALFSSLPVPESSQQPVVAKVQKKLRRLFALLLSLGIFLGITISILSGSLALILILPVVGAAAYGVCHWKALWMVPLFLLLSFGITLLILLAQHLRFNPWVCLFWTALAIVFSDIGVLIAGLLHFGLRKEKPDEN